MLPESVQLDQNDIAVYVKNQSAYRMSIRVDNFILLNASICVPQSSFNDAKPSTVNLIFFDSLG